MPYLFVVLGRLLVGLSKPGEEGLRSLADLAGSVAVGILLAGLGAPGRDNLLTDEIMMVVQLENLDDLREDLWIIVTEDAKEALGTTKKGPFVLLSCDNL
jgi:hypothetical protein